MPRSRYRITAADVKVVHRWIRERLRNDMWPKDWPRLTAWDKFPYEKPTAKTLQRWCDRFLDATQWKQLQAVIRAARRDLSQYRTVRLSRDAHEILGKLAMRDKLTLSEVIERYLSSVANAPATVPAVHAAESLPLHPVAGEETGATIATEAIADAAPWAMQVDPPLRVMKVELYLAVENNNKFVRGKKKAREEIEWSVLRRYQMEKSVKDGWEYVLSIPYHTDEELDSIIYDDILREAANIADYRHCFIETDVRSLDDPDRSW
jgi:hypothetical protein